MTNDSWREIADRSRAEKSAWLAQRQINQKFDAIQKKLDSMQKQLDEFLKQEKPEDD